jgi:DNA replication and repair protein RecF
VVLERLQLYCFRLYDDLVFEPQPGLNLLVGGNGAGKTALLEAAHLLSAARSFRAKREPEMVRWGQAACRVEGTFRNDRGRHRNLSLAWTRCEGEWTKSATFQGDKVPRLADFLGCVPCSLFTPDDLALVAGSPSVRRRYLDLQLSKTVPAHLLDLAQLKKVLASRNSLLRQGRPPRELLPWETLLFDLSCRIGERRERLVGELDNSCREYHLQLAGDSGGAVSLRYRRCWPVDREGFRERLKELYDKERQQGTTLLSPQKDELEINTQGRSLRLYGSQGQQRTLALCLRLAEARSLSEHHGEGAILLLDDVFSELDPERRERLLGLLPSFAQVLVTSATPIEFCGQGVSAYQVGEGCVFPLGGG